jgi:hypothetical protein
MDESDLELNTKVEAYKILHMLTKFYDFLTSVQRVMIYLLRTVMLSEF